MVAPETGQGGGASSGPAPPSPAVRHHPDVRGLSTPPGETLKQEQTAFHEAVDLHSRLWLGLWPKPPPPPALPTCPGPPNPPHYGNWKTSSTGWSSRRSYFNPPPSESFVGSLICILFNPIYIPLNHECHKNRRVFSPTPFPQITLNRAFPKHVSHI